VTAFLPLLLIPIIALLNHLRGQNGALPDSRVTYTALMGVAYGLAAWLVGIPPDRCVVLGCVTALGLIFWDVWTWGDEFLAVAPHNDTRDYTRMPWLCHFCDWCLGTSEAVKLTPAQAASWGTIYGSIRGLFLVPLFIALAYLLDQPEIAVLGTLGASQGIAYRVSPSVYVAEFIFGGVVGALLAATLITGAY
jgi:hypothetical protein